jgi:predicted transcriptional regulator
LPDLQNELPSLIRQHLRSVWGLEILLLLQKTAEREWLPDEIARELRATTSLVDINLKLLERSGLVAGEGGRYRFQPASESLKSFVDALAEAYRERPVSVINLIAAPDDAIQKLADAFRFRGRQ